MKTTYDGRVWYTLADVAEQNFIAYATVYSMLKAGTIAPPTHRVTGGLRDYYDEVEMVTMSNFFTQYRNVKSAVRLAKVNRGQPDLDK